MQSRSLSTSKNESIRDSLAKTKDRRRSQLCKQYELKLDKSHLNNQTLYQLERLFLEAKWFYNSIIASQHIFALPNDYYKTKQTTVKVKDKFETRTLECLSSQMKQEILDRTKDSVRALSTLKRNGRKIGSLKFKSRVYSIPLKQYGNTWKIQDKNHVRIQGIERKRLRVRGLIQIPEDSEKTSALLIRKHGDYYLHVAIFQGKNQAVSVHASNPNTANESIIGIDYGIRNQLTLSNGVRINYKVPLTARIKRLQIDLSRKDKHSKNWNRAKEKLEKEHNYLFNRKKDMRNKIIHKLTRTFQIICYQDDAIKGWQKNYGKQILNTGIGGITCALKQKAQTPLQVQRFFPSTQLCSKCHSLNKIERDDRTYCCKTCGLSIDRDLNAAMNIECQGLMIMKERLPTEDITRRKVTPADTGASTLELAKYLSNIPRVRASTVEETGSPAVIVKSTIFSRG